ncbi:NACHT domain-containing protein [Paractinoplanes durhamensis]
MLFNLAADCPDMGLWVDRRHQVAVEQRLDLLSPSLRELERLLREVAAAGTAEGVPGALRRAHAALLEHGIVETVDLPDGLDVPTLDRGYLPPAFQVAERPANRSPADEATWQDVEVRHDIDRFLAGYLGSPRALRAPLLVLGQPGAGKSVLTRILAARLAETRFLPIRVPLRDVDSSVLLQQQIEQAVLAATTEETTWSQLARTTEALPVIIFDGFDELLQATGVSQTDFLQKAAEFQQRELEQGRAAAVIVTSRISVADRAALPPATLLMRLQPFDEPRIRSWVATWNDVNAAGLAARGCAPLDPEAVLAHPDLSGQPLLLLMLALYDSDANALRGRGRLTTGELYEQLLLGFARREVTKAYPNLSSVALEPHAEQELSRLAVVAFAMLNRSAQWVAEDAVAQDLKATLGEPAIGRHADALSPSELIFGRFFFIHRAQAVRGGKSLRTYEFLHATFAEYLVARFTWRLLREAVARDAVTLAVRPMTGNDLMADLLSQVSLTGRAPIVAFLTEMAARLAPAEREQWTDVLVRIFRQAEREGAWPVSGYQPVPRRNVAARFAAYTVNLTLLAVITSGGLLFSELAEPAETEPRRQWHDHAMLWHAQLDDEGWGTLAETFAIERLDSPRGRDVHLSLDDGGFRVPRVDPRWLIGAPELMQTFAGGLDWATNSRRLHFEGGVNNDLMRHTLEPFADSGLGSTTRFFRKDLAGVTESAARTLLAVWVLPATGAGPAVAAETYRRCLEVLVKSGGGWGTRLKIAYADQLLAALMAHHDAPPEAAHEVLVEFAGNGLGSTEMWLRTAGTVLARADRDDPVTGQIADLVVRLVQSAPVTSDPPGLLAAVVRAVVLLQRPRRGPDVVGKLNLSRGPASPDEIRGELESFRVLLSGLRSGTDRWRADLHTAFDEFSWLAAGSEQLRSALVALAAMPGTISDVEAALTHVDDSIGTWLTDNP